MSQPTVTPKEIEQMRKHRQRHFDNMSNAAVVRAMIWRNRCPLLLVSNVALIVYIVHHNII